MPAARLFCMSRSPSDHAAMHEGLKAAPHAVAGRRAHTLPMRKERGQVLIWFLAFAATLAVVFAGVYSVGQVTSEKQKIVNAADAAAYSGAMVEARALNLTSYTNRAVIANEVLLAQIVSLDSWTSYFEQATDTYQKEAKVLSAVPIPVVNVFFKALQVTLKVTNQIAKVQSKVVDAAARLYVPSWELVYLGWYTGAIQTGFIPPAMALAVNTAAQSVLTQNVATQDGRTDSAPRLLHADAMALRNQIEWERLSKRYNKTGTDGTASDDRKYAANLALESRDEFAKNRPGSDVFLLKTFFGNSDFCVPFVMKFGSEKLGPTQLVKYNNWEAQDTVEFKIKPGPFLCNWGKGQVGVPQGWGRATASDKGRIMNTTGGAGAKAFKENHNNGGYTGIKRLYDVKRDDQGKRSREESSVAVVAGKAAAAVPTNESLNFMNRPMTGPMGSPDLKAGFASDQISAVAEARVFFERPVRNARDITGGSLLRADGNKEYASFYNPYWQVRLATPSTLTRGAAYIAGDINPALVIFAP